MSLSLLLTLHAAATWGMVGVIWLVQLLVYPAMREVPAERWIPWHLQHCQRISYVVGPLMLGEVFTALGLWLQGLSGAVFYISLALLAVNWLSTLVIQIPLHGICEGVHSPTAIRQLITTNWIRTLAWSARGALVGVLVLEATRV
ncbi:MAG: hypothetical protein ACOYOF_18225 [Verrucomicrobiaceae bacterium]|jgi:hypothetical protein